jgi:hypothetical protein
VCHASDRAVQGACFASSRVRVEARARWIIVLRRTSLKRPRGIAGIRAVRGRSANLEQGLPSRNSGLGYVADLPGVEIAAVIRVGGDSAHGLRLRSRLDAGRGDVRLRALTSRRSRSAARCTE